MKAAWEAAARNRLSRFVGIRSGTVNAVSHGRGGSMKRQLTQTVGSIILAGSLLGGVYAQDMDKQVRREAKREAKDARSLEKWDRWAERKGAKRIKQLEKERRFDTPFTARGSEVKFLDLQGKYVTIGYIDKTNK